MIKEKILTETVTCCDSCETTLYEPTSLRNDSSYQSTFIRIGNIDLCYICGARILESLRAPEEKAKEWVEKLKLTMKNDKSLVRPTLEGLSDEMSFIVSSAVSNSIPLSDIDKAPNLASLDLVTLTIPEKTSSNIPNLGEL